MKEEIPPAVLYPSHWHCTASGLREGFLPKLLPPLFHLPSAFLTSASFLHLRLSRVLVLSLGLDLSYKTSVCVSYSLPLALLSESPIQSPFPHQPRALLVFFVLLTALCIAVHWLSSLGLGRVMTQALFSWISQPLSFSSVLLSCLC